MLPAGSLGELLLDNTLGTPPAPWLSPRQSGAKAGAGDFQGASTGPSGCSGVAPWSRRGMHRAMVNSGDLISHDAFYLDATARLFGWAVAWMLDGSARMSQRDWTVHAFFDHDGAFRYGCASGPGTGDLELKLTDVVDVLEHYGILFRDADAP